MCPNLVSSLRCSYDVPLVADIHFQPKVAMMVADAFEKIRINPGARGGAGSRQQAPGERRQRRRWLQAAVTRCRPCCALLSHLAGWLP